MQLDELVHTSSALAIEQSEDISESQVFKIEWGGESKIPANVATVFSGTALADVIDDVFPGCTGAEWLVYIASPSDNPYEVDPADPYEIMTRQEQDTSISYLFCCIYRDPPCSLEYCRSKGEG